MVTFITHYPRMQESTAFLLQKVTLSAHCWNAAYTKKHPEYPLQIKTQGEKQVSVSLFYDKCGAYNNCAQI